MRYKTGDKVYLRDDLDKEMVYNGLDFVNGMKKGQVVTIRTVYDCDYSIKEDYTFNYNDAMIDHDKTAQLSSDARESDLTKDNVNHPIHYTKGEIETIDKIKYLTEDFSGIEAVCIGNFIKYIDRCNLKGGMQDLEKAKWYLDRFIDEFYDDIIKD